MPFDDDISVADPEATTVLLRHVLKVWAREHGVEDARLHDVVRDVLEFASATLRAR